MSLRQDDQSHGAFPHVGGAERVAPPSSRLRILSTTDLHGQFLSYDYLSNRPLYGCGLAQLSALIAKARAEVDACLLLDNGDFLQGNGLEDAVRSVRQKTWLHPAVAAFRALQYDAVALGNHEFNFGLDLLREVIGQATFPVLSANVLVHRDRDPLRDRFLARPHALLKRSLTLADGSKRDLTIGLLGLTPPQILQWDGRHLLGKVFLRDMVSAAKTWAKELRRLGADLVICLAHTGVPLHLAEEDPEAQAHRIAEIAEIDAVIAGHTHLVYPEGTRNPKANPVARDAALLHGKPVVQPGHSGSHLGLIDLWLEPQPAGGWRITETHSAALSAAEALVDLPQPLVKAAENPLRLSLRKYHRSTLERLRRPFGETQTALTTYFALVADCAALRLAGLAQIAYFEASAVAKTHSDLPIVALVSPFRVGGRGGPLNYTDIPAGTLSLRSIYDLYPYPNAVSVEIMSARQLAERLDLGSSIFHQLTRGQQNQPLINSALPGYSFEIAVGLGYEIDLAQAAPNLRGPEGQSRIGPLSYRGRRLAPEERIVVVSNSYLASLSRRGGRHVVLEDGASCTKVLADHVRRHRVIPPLAGEGWRFTPMPGTSTSFDTGLGAIDHMAEARHLHPEPLGLTQAGFQRFRLHL